MTVKMIVAVDQGNAIGWNDGNLPWKIPADMKRFKALTTGSTVFMGRSTFESLGRPAGLPNRRNVVLSNAMHFLNKCDPFEVIDVTNTWDWVRAHQECLGCEPDDLWIIGGASVYAQALELQLIDELYVTLVHANSGADVSLPFDLFAWKLFILQQAAKLGVIWGVTETEIDTSGEIPLTFMKLSKAAK